MTWHDVERMRMVSWHHFKVIGDGEKPADA